MLTQILRNMEPRRPRMLGLGALLLGMVGLMVLMTWQAYRADRAREALGRQFLSNTAALAARDWNRVASDALFSSLVATFEGVHALDASDAGRTPSAMLVLDSISLAGVCDCIQPQDIRYAFTIDLTTGAVSTSAPTSSAAIRWLVPRVRDLRPMLYTPVYGVGFTTHADEVGEPLVFPYLVRTEAGRAVAAFGFAARPVVLEWFLDNAVGRDAVVPSELLRAGRNDSTFVFTVTDQRGRRLYTSGAAAGADAFERHQPMDELLAGLELSVQILPGAESSILGGSFRSRLPLLMTLLAFTLGVAAFAIYLIKRESELAALRDNFVAGVSHELRTPLAQIRMFAETLRLGRFRSPADRRRSLEIIDHESRRLTHLVENVLQFARSGRGAIHLRLESADMAADVRDAIHAFAVLHRSPDVEVRAELQDGILASVDRDALRQILLNLLENAAKYGPLTQRITVGMALIGSSVRLWVDDEGVGVPTDERERVFEAFYRLSRDANSAVGGSGIGLSIVRELARAHGGACRIEEAPGGGARVIVEFPEARLRSGIGSAVA